MQIQKKINLKIYLLLTLGSLAISGVFLSTNRTELISQVLVIVGAAINQFLLVYTISLLVSVANGSRHVFLPLFLFIIKILILSATFYFYIERHGDRVIMAMILYIFQLIILGFSIKK